MPYTEHQISEFFRIADQQRTSNRRRTSTAHLCLGLGAGLFADEYLNVTSSSFRTVASTNVLVLAGERPRQIPISERYFLPLQEIAAQHPGEPLIGATGNGSNDRFNHLLSKVEYPGRIGNPVTTRLRTTWMQHMLAIPVSLSEFTAMAGILTTKSLTDLIPYIPERAPVLWYRSVAQYPT
ncbi:hypothetical protein [Arthrobacter ramosus]|uniref:Tyr recombinase domain-containing protein n=1 Tax=Arthrobacter ramosus TaxID=1672 RepID=A0ABV5XXM1_ARTRM|nr:hypothetical protein [Arthrobacter ramosus]